MDDYGDLETRVVQTNFVCRCVHGRIPVCDYPQREGKAGPHSVLPAVEFDGLKKDAKSARTVCNLKSLEVFISLFRSASRRMKF